jgi:hypothetical protein
MLIGPRPASPPKTQADSAEEYRHMPVRALAMCAQRAKKVFAAAATWARLIKQRGWLRPRKRLYPDKPTEGIRASRPGEILHIDVTIIKLLDGTKTYLHAVIDNFSLRILAWKLMPRLEPMTTCLVLAPAAKELGPTLDPANPTTVTADSGVGERQRPGRRAARSAPLATYPRSSRGGVLE